MKTNAHRSVHWGKIVKTAHVVRCQGNRGVSLQIDKRGHVTGIMYPLSVVWRSPVPPAGIYREKPLPDSDGLYGHDTFIYDQNIPPHVQTQILGQPNDRYPGLMERLRAEAEVIIASFESEVKKKTDAAEKRRVSRFTGDGARARVDKIIELISNTLKGVDPDLDARTLHKVIRVHARTRFVSEDSRSEHFLRVDTEVMKAMEEEGLEWVGAARTVASFGKLSLIAIFHHISSNPGHWDLVTEDDIVIAVKRAFVMSVMEI